MGTNSAPIFTNLYLAMSHEELKKKCLQDKKLNGQVFSKDSKSINGFLVIMWSKWIYTYI